MNHAAPPCSIAFLRARAAGAALAARGPARLAARPPLAGCMSLALLPAPPLPVADRYDAAVAETQGTSTTPAAEVSGRATSTIPPCAA